MSVITDKRLNKMIAGMKLYDDMPCGIKINEFSAKDLYSAMVELRELRQIGTARQWVPVSERLPENRQRVIVALKNEYGRIWRTCAEYIAPKAVLAEDFLDEGCEYEEFAEYDAEKDCYYAPDGFYESNYCTDENYHIGEKVLAWMPLPPLPGGGQE